MRWDTIEFFAGEPCFFLASERWNNLCMRAIEAEGDAVLAECEAKHEALCKAEAEAEEAVR